MAFKEYFDLVPRLELPIRGKTYEIPPVSFEDLARWRAYREKVAAGKTIAKAKQITDDEFTRLFLGSVRDDMVADGASWRAVVHAAATAMADAEQGREVAERVWDGPLSVMGVTLQGDQHE